MKDVLEFLIEPMAKTFVNLALFTISLFLFVFVTKWAVILMVTWWLMMSLDTIWRKLYEEDLRGKPLSESNHQ